MVRLEDILERVKTYKANPDVDIIKRAYIFAAIHHGADVRRSGEPFILHPLEVANILATLKCDEITIATGILHDVVEDTDIKVDDIKKYFGEEIAFLVNSLTKVDEIEFKTVEERQAENIRKILLAMAKDIRVILVKLSDRLHNLRTIHYLEPEKQKRIAQESLEIYAPLAHRLGIYWLKTEIEDISFRVLHPDKYVEIEEKLRELKKRKEKYIQETSSKLKEMLEKEGIECEVSGRFKSIYSIYQKMKKENLPFEEIYDVLAFRVITKSVMDCYKALGIIHQYYKPIFERFKDYISRPKSNNYQSLHTTVIGENSEKIEIQIRTYEMHREAEEGVAAHWAYKEGKEKPFEELKIYSWFKKLLELKDDERDPLKFVSGVKEELFADEVLVITPKGDIIELPKGSTPVDFAYAIHSEIGHRCKAAEVNGKIVPLNTELKTGDRVKIITGNEPNPKKDWLNFVKTSRAKAKIRAWINAREREGLLRIGRIIMEREMRKIGKQKKMSEKKEKLNELINSLGFKNEESFYIAIGAGKLNAKNVIKKLFPEEEKVEPKKFSLFPSLPRKETEIIVDGLEDICFKFARCCNPLPGEKIVGHISPKKGLIIHSSNCKKIESIAEDRLLDVRWSENKGRKRKVKLKIECQDRPGLLADISNTISKENINISDAYAKPAKNALAFITMHLELESFTQLQRIMKAIREVDGVMNVERA